jgi:hypothetical protein
VNGTVTLADYLEAKRVSELQEFHSFWGNGDPAPSRKPELKASLLRLMNDEETMAKKLRVLSQTPTQLLLILIRSDDFRADIQSVFYNDHGIQLEYYEVEAAAPCPAGVSSRSVGTGAGSTTARRSTPSRARWEMSSASCCPRSGEDRARSSLWADTSPGSALRRCAG